MAKPLALDADGRIGLKVNGALAVDKDGGLYIRLGDGLTVAPGSPLRLQLDLADDSLEITKEGKLRARPKASQIRIDARKVGALTLDEAIDRETELQSRRGQPNGYASLDSTGKVPAAMLPASPVPLDIYINSIRAPTSTQRVITCTDSSTPVNWFDIANADSGNPLQVSADGSDTDISINLLPKGVGEVQVNGNRVEDIGYKNIPGGYAGLDGLGLLSYGAVPTLDHGDKLSGLGDNDHDQYMTTESYMQTTVANPDQCYCANIRTGVALGTKALAANTEYWIPFVAPVRGATISTMQIQVTTASAGTSVIVGLYACKTNGGGIPDSGDFRPTGSALASATQSTAATGTFSIAVSYALTAGQMYWFCILSSGAPTLRGGSTNSCDLALGWTLPSGTTAPAAVTHWTSSRTFASGLRTGMTGTETYTNGTGAQPCVFYTYSA